VFFKTIVSAIVAGIVAGSALSLIQRWTSIPLIYWAELQEQSGGSEHRPSEPPQDVATRTAYTLVGDILLACGFGLILSAAFIVTGQSGFLSGIGLGLVGFAIFHLGPAIVVPPLIPGLKAGSLAARQAIWLVAASTTTIGLVLLIFGSKSFKLVGALLMALPLVIDEIFPIARVQSGPTTAYERSFIFWSLVGSMVMWLLLGAVSGALYAWLDAGDTDT
jgi:predicted cobalt transporter CbtA